ncbi:MAG: hypothetical protein HQK83_12030 [Fibrobacteria bacterium]|nr:hypothetical protein [Fibrobacteria bacterium]
MLVHKYVLFLCAIYCSLGFSTNITDEDDLNHYGIVVLSDTRISENLAGRFRATGPPIFLVHDLSIGVAQGDFMKFQDKVVLITSKVWQTLVKEGALDKLKQASVLRIQAKARSDSWDSRTKTVPEGRSKKAYKLGTEILKIFEDHFNQIPGKHEIILEFKGSHLVLTAPHNLIDKLKFRKVQKVPEDRNLGKPFFVTEPPDCPIKTGQTFFWQIWAADPHEPSADLEYMMEGELPDGLYWDRENHAVRGDSLVDGAWPVVFYVQNSINKRDSLPVTFTFSHNRAPLVLNEPLHKVRADEIWHFTPVLFDPDDDTSSLSLSVHNMPKGMLFDSVSHSLTWVAPDSIKISSFHFQLRVEDTAGAYSEKQYRVMVTNDSNRAPVFMSEPSGWSYWEGDDVHYRPVVVDPDGDSVTLQILVSDYNNFTWDGTRLHLGTKTSGVYQVEFIAKDSDGEIGKQRMIYRVVPRTQYKYGASLNFAAFDVFSPIEALVERKGMRAGFYFPVFFDLFQDNFHFKDNVPYIVVGTNLLSDRAYKNGNHLFVDGGLFLDRSMPKITAGGLLLRMDGRFFIPSDFPGFVDFELLGFARQAVLIIETFSNTQMIFEDKHVTSARELYQVYNDEKNLFISFRLEGWYPLGYGLWSGPFAWHYDVPIDSRYEQRLGWGLRFKWKKRSYSMQQSLQCAWGGTSAGFSVYWGAKINYGIWK